LNFTPSSGEESQSEYFVPRTDTLAAFEALDGIRDRIARILKVCEVRTITTDDLWLSPCYGRDTKAFPPTR
jgi:alditol oxidase